MFVFYGNDRVVVFFGVNKFNNWVIFVFCEWIIVVSLNDKIVYRIGVFY